jgi:hypothetical protein
VAPLVSVWPLNFCLCEKFSVELYIIPHNRITFVGSPIFEKFGSGKSKWKGCVAKEGFSFRLKEVESEIVGGWFVHVKFGYCCVKSVS